MINISNVSFIYLFIFLILLLKLGPFYVLTKYYYFFYELLIFNLLFLYTFSIKMKPWLPDFLHNMWSDIHNAYIHFSLKVDDKKFDISWYNKYLFIKKTFIGHWSLLRKVLGAEYMNVNNFKPELGKSLLKKMISHITWIKVTI